MTEKGGEVNSNEKDMSLGFFYWILVPRLGGSGTDLGELMELQRMEKSSKV